MHASFGSAPCDRLLFCKARAADAGAGDETKSKKHVGYREGQPLVIWNLGSNILGWCEFQFTSTGRHVHDNAGRMT